MAGGFHIYFAFTDEGSEYINKILCFNDDYRTVFVFEELSEKIRIDDSLGENIITYIENVTNMHTVGGGTIGFSVTE